MKNLKALFLLLVISSLTSCFKNHGDMPIIGGVEVSRNTKTYALDLLNHNYTLNLADKIGSVSILGFTGPYLDRTTEIIVYKSMIRRVDSVWMGMSIDNIQCDTIYYNDAAEQIYSELINQWGECDDINRIDYTNDEDSILYSHISLFWNTPYADIELSYVEEAENISAINMKATNLK